MRFLDFFRRRAVEAETPNPCADPRCTNPYCTDPLHQRHVPSRRSFLFLGAAAIIAPTLGQVLEYTGYTGFCHLDGTPTRIPPAMSSSLQNLSDSLKRAYPPEYFEAQARVVGPFYDVDIDAAPLRIGDLERSTRNPTRVDTSSPARMIVPFYLRP